MSAIKITVKSPDVVEIRAGNETLVSCFQDFYRNPGPRMRLAREVSDLIDRYQNKVEGQEGGGKKESARKKIISDLALLGQKTAQDIFGEDWAKIGDLLQKHSDDEIWVRNEEYVWIPWELLCHFPNRAPSLDSFIASRRNVYRDYHQAYRGSRSHVTTIPIAEAGLLAHLKWSDEEGARVEQVKSPCIAYSKHEMHNPEDRVSALQNLIKWLASMDIIHIGGIIVPLQHQNNSWLLIDRDFHLCIEDLCRSSAERPGFRKFDKKPLVILNMRDNYYRDPQQVLRYIRFFLQSDAMGVIASELPIPTQLALEFSEHFYRNLAHNGRSLGQILTATKSYLIERGSPFAMFYAPYFHPDVKLELEKEPVPVIPVPLPPESTEAASLRRQLTEARVNLQLIEERESQYVLTTDVPLQLVKEKHRWLERIAKLKRQLAGLGVEAEEQDAVGPLTLPPDQLAAIHDKLDRLLADHEGLRQGQAAIYRRLDAAQQQTVGEVLAGLRQARLDDAETTRELSGMLDGIRRALSDLQARQLPALDADVRRALDEVTETLRAGGDLRSGLELTVPLIPLLLSYRLSLEAGTGLDLRQVWENLLAWARRKEER